MGGHVGLGRKGVFHFKETNGLYTILSLKPALAVLVEGK